MRLTTQNWLVCGHIKTGHRHISNGTNGQDALAYQAIPGEGESSDIVVGVVCDGCSDSRHAEVGSKLLAPFILQQSLYLLATGISKSRHGSLLDIVDILFRRTVEFIGNNVLAVCRVDPEMTAAYLRDYWAATVLGCIIRGDEGIIFGAGDGVYVLGGPPAPAGDAITVIDQNGYPQYICYHCVLEPERFGVTDQDIPCGFVTREFAASAVDRVMIATDGFGTHNEVKLRNAEEALGQSFLPRSLHGLQWGKKGNAGLAKWMNVCWDRGYFDDDCGIVTIERQKHDQVQMS